LCAEETQILAEYAAPDRLSWWVTNFTQHAPAEQARMRREGHLGLPLPVRQALQAIERLDEQENLGFETRRTDPTRRRRRTTPFATP